MVTLAGRFEPGAFRPKREDSGGPAPSPPLQLLLMNLLKLSLGLFAICVISGTIYAWQTLEDGVELAVISQTDGGEDDLLQVQVSYALERLEDPSPNTLKTRRYSLACNYEIVNAANTAIRFTWPPLSMMMYRESNTSLLSQTGVEHRFEMKAGERQEIILEPDGEVQLGYIRSFHRFTADASEASDELHLNDWEVIGLNVWVDDAVDPNFMHFVLDPSFLPPGRLSTKEAKGR